MVRWLNLAQRQETGQQLVWQPHGDDKTPVIYHACPRSSPADKAPITSRVVFMLHLFVQIKQTRCNMLISKL